MGVIESCAGIILISILLFFLRCFYFQLCCLGKPRFDETRNSRRTRRLMVILGSGGHTTEALELLEQLDVQKYHPVTFVLAETDTTSVARAKLVRKIDSDGYEEVKFVKIPRSREVRQSWHSTIWSTAYAVLFAFPIVWNNKPDVIIANGPGTCVPLCMVAWFFNVICLRKIVITFVESICRVQTLSLSGKILYYFADVFLVQYPYLKDKYPRSTYLGRLV